MDDHVSAAHLGDNDLVLHHYGEAEDQAEAERHLAGCARCRENYDGLLAVLAAVESVPAPQRDDLDAARLWRWLRPELAGVAAAGVPRVRTPAARRRWALAAAAALVLSGGFMAGRLWRPAAPAELTEGPIPAAVRERILLVAVGDHLDRSQMALLELLNAGDGGGAVDVAGGRKAAADLVAANRIYRQSAAASGDTALAVVLEELERVLLDVARGPGRLPPEELASLQRRIREQGILLKLRVIGSQVRERGKATAEALAGDRT